MLLFRKILSLFLGIVNIIRAVLNRMICSVRRMRHNSGTLLPMTTDQVLSPNVLHGVHQSLPSNEPVQLEAWDAWGQEESTLSGPMSNGQQASSNHIESYYASRKQREGEPETQPEPDYFTGMIPSLKKATKIKIIKKDDGDKSATSTRLKVDSSLLPAATDELGELASWEEGENAWAAEAEEDLSCQAESALRETRRQEREERQVQQKRKRQEKDASRVRKDSSSLSAVRLS